MTRLAAALLIALVLMPSPARLDQQALNGLSYPIFVYSPRKSQSRWATDATNVSVGFTIKTDGLLYATEAGVEAAGLGRGFAVTHATSLGNYEVMLHVSASNGSGTPTGTFDSWLDLSTNRTWLWSTLSGSPFSRTNQLSIRRAGTSQVLQTIDVAVTN